MRSLIGRPAMFRSASSIISRFVRRIVRTSRIPDRGSTVRGNYPAIRSSRADAEGKRSKACTHKCRGGVVRFWGNSGRRDLTASCPVVT